MVTQMKGYFLNAYHCWAFLAGHLSCYKYFFLPDVHYKCKLFCNQRGRLNTFYFESKKKRRFQDALKHSEYFSPTRTCLQPWSQKECIQQEVHIFCWSQTLLCGKPHLNKKKNGARECKVKLETPAIRKPVAELGTKVLFQGAFLRLSHKTIHPHVISLM